MAIYKGSQAYSKIYLGSTQIQKIYKGTQLYYSAMDVDAVALLARMDVQPSAGLALLIEKTIKDLKTAGIWQKTDFFMKFNLHTQQASLLNWKGNYLNGINVNGRPHTSNFGFAYSPTAYIKNGFIPQAINAGNYNYKNNNVYFLVDGFNNQLANRDGFNLVGSTNVAWAGRFQVTRPADYLMANSNVFNRVYNGETYPRAEFSTEIGIYLREGSLCKSYADKVNTFSYSNSSIVDITFEAYYGMLNWGGTPMYAGRETLRTVAIGSSLTESESYALTDIIKYFNDNVARYGAELMSNGTFTTTAGWSGNGGSIHDGRLYLSGVVNNYMMIGCPWLAGKKYRIKYNCQNLVGNISLGTGSGNWSPLANGDMDYIYTTGNYTGTFYFYLFGTASCNIDNLSIKEVL